MFQRTWAKSFIYLLIFLWRKRAVWLQSLIEADSCNPCVRHSPSFYWWWSYSTVSAAQQRGGRRRRTPGRRGWKEDMIRCEKGGEGSRREEREEEERGNGRTDSGWRMESELTGWRDIFLRRTNRSRKKKKKAKMWGKGGQSDTAAATATISRTIFHPIYRHQRSPNWLMGKVFGQKPAHAVYPLLKPSYVADLYRRD